MNVEKNLDKIMSKGKTLFLAYDQGLEHGPTDFNDQNVDPQYIIDIAKKGKYNAVIFQKGIAEKYNKEIKASRVPLIVKLNGKTRLVKGEPISARICSVKDAVSLGAKAVGFTLYIGSEHEEEMMEEFKQIQEEAHAKGLPVVTWIYPRGEGVKGMSDRELVAYACRVGLEIGADIIKVHFDGSLKDLKWAVKSAGKAKVVLAGGSKATEKELLSNVKKVMAAGCIGLAIGRNVWQAKDPMKITKEIKKIIWEK